MPARETAPLGAPRWIELSSSDPEQARDFYAALFGWTYEVGDAQTGDYVTCFLNGAPVASITRNDADSGPTDAWTTYFSSTDAQATADLADESGGQSAVAPVAVGSMGTIALLEDPGGALVGVWQAGEDSGPRAAVSGNGAPVWHELHTRHFRASVLFYETVFGWRTSVLSDTDEFRFTTASFDGDELAGIFDAMNTIGEDTPASWEVYFGVNDVDQTLALAETLGATVLEGAEDSPYGRLAALTDPTGARFRVMTPSDWQPSP
jgi:predicted enzyme related to lactoylglutathione lyase